MWIWPAKALTEWPWSPMLIGHWYNALVFDGRSLDWLYMVVISRRQLAWKKHPGCSPRMLSHFLSLSDLNTSSQAAYAPSTDAAILRFLQHFSTTRRCFASLVVVYSSSYFQYITLFDPFIVHLTKKIIQSQKIFRKVIPDFLQRSKSLSSTLSSRVVCATC